MMIKDFNLLRLLLVLNEERQTTLAAKRLHLSQPTISVMLRKLREQFNDPLFVRDKNQLEPTVRCQQLLMQLPALLDQLDSLYINQKNWDISLLEGEITLILSPPLMSSFAAPLVSKLSAQAPLITVECYHWGFEAQRDLELKNQCWGFSYLPMETNKNILQKDIGDDEFVMVMRKDHPLQSSELSAVLAYPLCINLIFGESSVSRSEQILKSLELDKKISVRTSDIGLMLALVADGDYIGIVSRNIAARFPYKFRFEPLPHSLPNKSRFRSIALFTHQRNRIDPLTNWLFEEASAIIDGE
ncbi:LysR family transcriptional regulator [Agarivorans sp. QJM3NY_33]|uniref:LysR family transcriptional regulator n=1 Tax=Agarivorans sp. QJM3NY_33 TaxID=3421432 RepID=UPI003D7F1720